ncbi:hypothetical protein SAMN05518672_108208 [Chitinophaga sp. CF118]|uniref:hypothetical protein n=1 Tax=Chitinophaga sp. CF118 TaxID=1884367 RepID=UPI0008EFB62C|nr:hypothetical protein [Chitinophaga sp. CF118]SFE64116.1 hypothetical protein SAMN05518672_108208 [Chitinophaga sp. CF118]
MVNLILDTNQWVYLNNALDPHSGNQQPGQHFKLLEKILEMVEAREITLWKMDLILEEWTRNKGHAHDLIEKIKRQRSETITNLKKLNKELGDDADTQVKLPNGRYEKKHPLKVTKATVVPPMLQSCLAQ